MASFREVGERALIGMIRNVVHRDGAPDDLSDDASFVKTQMQDLVACTDSLTFDRHRPEGMTYEQFGWMCAAANLSDLASMGARPVGLLAALNVPLDMDAADICDIMSGIDQCAEFADTYIIGGDTKPGNGIVTVTAIGTMDGRVPMTRRGARTGDVIAVTGPLGGPAAGFRALENGMELPDSVSCLFTPIPRVEEGLALSKSGRVSSCMDLSDGLATCINTLCRESGVGAIIDWDLLPKDDGVQAVCERTGVSDEELVLGWGGEYELLFTFDRKYADELYGSGVDFHMIGLVTEDEVLLHRNEKYKVIEDGCY